MRGRIGLLLAGAALAIGGGVAGAVVVAPALVEEGATAGFERAGKETRATPQHTFQVAKKARGMARGARQLANGLVDEVEQAQSTAAQALNAAGAANTRIDSTQIALGTASSRVVTGVGSNYVPLAGGPQVTVTVPSSGYIEVWASATIGDETDTTVAGDGAVALFEDGQLVPIPNQQGFCTSGSPNLDDALIGAEAPPGVEVTLSTPPVLVLALGCGSAGGTPGSLVFKRSPGTHTYELRYGDCGCDPEPAAFSDRVLQVAPRL